MHRIKDLYNTQVLVQMGGFFGLTGNGFFIDLLLIRALSPTGFFLFN